MPVCRINSVTPYDPVKFIGRISLNAAVYSLKGIHRVFIPAGIVAIVIRP
jgi:hypothetical protein